MIDLHGLACCGAVGTPAKDEGDRVRGYLVAEALGRVFGVVELHSGNHNE